jgi:chorismate synthase
MSGTFGTLFKVTSFGESHSKGIGVITDGCPPGIYISKADIQPQLNRRRPDQNRLTTARNEPDQVNILSGIENGLTVGTPVALFLLMV